MAIEIRKADPAGMADRVTVFQYESEGHYRMSLRENPDGWTIDLKREKFPETFRKKDNDKVITPYKGQTEIYCAFEDGKEIGFIQIEFQDWNETVRLWDIDVLLEHRGKGAGTALMDACKSRSKELGARRIILETQSSNLPAIGFYKKNGFSLGGLDTSCYTNKDIEKGEVRLEMVLLLE